MGMKAAKGVLFFNRLQPMQNLQMRQFRTGIWPKAPSQRRIYLNLT